jgi:hypothetical protein
MELFKAAAKNQIVIWVTCIFKNYLYNQYYRGIYAGAVSYGVMHI